MKCEAKANISVTYEDTELEKLQLAFLADETVPLLITSENVDYLICDTELGDLINKDLVHIEYIDFKEDGNPIAQKEPGNTRTGHFRRLFDVPFEFDDLEYYVSQMGYNNQISQEQFEQFLNLIEQDVV